MAAIVDDLHASVAEDKASIVASSPALGKELEAFLGRFAGGKSSNRATNLGVDDAAGQALRRGNRLKDSKKASRMNVFRKLRGLLGNGQGRFLSRDHWQVLPLEQRGTALRTLNF